MAGLEDVLSLKKRVELDGTDFLAIDSSNQTDAVEKARAFIKKCFSKQSPVPLEWLKKEIGVVPLRLYTSSFLDDRLRALYRVHGEGKVISNAMSEVTFFLKQPYFHIPERYSDLFMCGFNKDARKKVLKALKHTNYRVPFDIKSDINFFAYEITEKGLVFKSKYGDGRFGVSSHTTHTSLHKDDLFFSYLVTLDNEAEHIEKLDFNYRLTPKTGEHRTLEIAVEYTDETPNYVATAKIERRSKEGDFTFKIDQDGKVGNFSMSGDNFGQVNEEALLGKLKDQKLDYVATMINVYDCCVKHELDQLAAFECLKFRSD